MTKNKIVAYAHFYVGMGHNAGAEETLHELLKHLVKSGWSADVIISSPSPGLAPYTIDGVNVHPQIDRRTIVHWVPKASVVITHLENSERATLLAKKYRVPCIQLIHNDMHQTHGYVALNPDMVVWNTDWIGSGFNYSGLSIVVHPAIDKSRYDPKSDPDRSYVTMVNAFPAKGTSTFYNVAARMPNTKFLMVTGGYGNQDIRDGYENIVFHDHTDDMSEIYRITRVVLMPSEYESYGRVGVEAASQGIPVLSSDTPGLTEALGSAGTFIPNDDSAVDTYVSALTKLQHWKAYAAASKRASARFKVLEKLSNSELDQFRVVIDGIAETGRLLRGW